MEFVAFLGNDKENWGQVSALVNRLECERVFLVRGKSAEGFPKNAKCKEIVVNTAGSLIDLKEEIMKKLKPELSGDFEVSLSLASGNGKEHMALISALLSIPVGIRLVVFTKEGVKFVN